MTMTFITVCAAVVGLFIALFGSWPGMHPSCRQNCAVAGGCRKSCSEWHIRAGFENSFDTEERQLSYSQYVLCPKQEAGWHSVLLICTGDVNSCWECTVGITGRGNRTKHISWLKDKQAVMNGTSYFRGAYHNVNFLSSSPSVNYEKMLHHYGHTI